MAWRKKVDLSEWLHQYSVRRYGADSERMKRMWDILLPRVYTQSGRGEGKSFQRFISTRTLRWFGSPSTTVSTA